VTVEPPTEETAMHLLEARLENVTLDDAYLENASQKSVDYLLELDAGKFLYSFYETAGLEPTADTPTAGGSARVACGSRATSSATTSRRCPSRTPPRRTRRPARASSKSSLKPSTD
jgi:hypothetical protein